MAKHYHVWERHTSSEPTAAGMYIEEYLKCAGCGEIRDAESQPQQDGAIPEDLTKLYARCKTRREWKWGADLIERIGRAESRLTQALAALQAHHTEALADDVLLSEDDKKYAGSKLEEKTLAALGPDEPADTQKETN